MARPAPAAKVPPPKHLVALAFVAILDLVLVDDFLWASSSASSSAAAAIWSSRLDLSTRPTASLPPAAKKQAKENKSIGSTDINATFADLPAPQLEWEEMAEAPVARLDGTAIQAKGLLYVFAGYGTINYVHSHVDVYNFSDNSWGGRFDVPKEMAHSHLGMVTDGGFIYVVLDSMVRHVGDLQLEILYWTLKQKNGVICLHCQFLDILQPQLWRGRLHVMGGSKEDRHEPGLEHWSLAVKDGKALEKE